MQKKELAEKLSALSGRTFQFDKETFTVRGFSVEYPTFTIYTDGESLAGLMPEAEQFIDKLISKELTLAKPAAQAAALPEPVSNLFTEMIGIAKDNIKKVQDNPDYVEQAAEVRNNLGSLIDIVKTEISFRKTLKS